MKKNIHLALGVLAVLGFSTASQAQSTPLPDPISYLSVQDNTGPFINPVTNTAGSLSDAGTDGSSSAASFSGFTVSPTLTAVSTTTSGDGSAASSTSYYEYYAEIVPDAGVADPLTTVGLDVFASGSASSTVVTSPDGIVWTGVADAIFFLNQAPYSLGSWEADAGHFGSLSGTFSVDDTGATAIQAAVGAPIEVFLEAEAGGHAGDVSSAVVDPLLSIDPAYADDYSLVFSLGVAPDTPSSVSDAESTAAMLGIAGFGLIVLGRRLRHA